MIYHAMATKGECPHKSKLTEAHQAAIPYKYLTSQRPRRHNVSFKFSMANS